MNCQSGEKATVPPAVKVRRRVPSETFQNLIPDVASCWLSGEYSPKVGPLQCRPLHWMIVRIKLPFDAFHNLLFLSSPPDASCWPSGENAVYLTYPVCAPCQTMSGLPCADTERTNAINNTMLNVAERLLQLCLIRITFI